MSSENTILLGLDNDGNKLYSSDYQHILLVAPHGAGKGVCFVIPSLLSFQESAIVHDIKLENYQLTSGYRASIGHKVFVWNPLGEKDKTNRYNPLDFISLESERIVDDIQKISNLLIQSEENDKVDVRNLFAGIVLYLCVNATKTKSFGEIARMLTGGLIDELSGGIDKLKSTIHPTGYQIITAFLKKDKQEQSSIIRSLSQYLEPWLNPLVDYATSESDFNIADFKRQKTTLYVGLIPADINRLQPVMQFFYQHVAERLMVSAQHLGYSEKNIGICLYMDDICSVGKLELLKSCIPYFRGYKIKLFLITSDIEQIEKTYGEADAQGIISTCAFKIAFAANDYKTAKKLSQMCIDRAKNTELSWQQIINLSPDSQIILQNHEQPIISKKIFYYEDEEVKKKIIDQAPIS